MCNPRHIKTGTRKKLLCLHWNPFILFDPIGPMGTTGRGWLTCSIAGAYSRPRKCVLEVRTCQVRASKSTSPQFAYVVLRNGSTIDKRWRWISYNIRVTKWNEWCSLIVERDQNWALCSRTPWLVQLNWQPHAVRSIMSRAERSSKHVNVNE